ncbi:IclR family transcriptional regulator [Lentzea sp. NPDC102401]|uniref:IclR family transcriptional regulator n=1 Tax=Lentzea sp. NPDC102401 TaxID=3364128 RepID=UPI00382B92A4
MVDELKAAREPGQPMLERAFRVLRTLGAADRPLSLTSLSARSGLPKSTVLRMTRTLVGLGMLERCTEGWYTIGLGLWELATQAPRAEEIRATVLPSMWELHTTIGQHVVLGVLDGTEAVVIERLSAQGAVKTLYRLGGRLPLHATAVGQCLLANAPIGLQEQVLAGRLVTAPENEAMCSQRLRTRLAAVRNDGVAVVSHVMPEGHTAVAAPVLDGQGRVRAALAVIVPSPGCNVVALRAAVTASCHALNRAIRDLPRR